MMTFMMPQQSQWSRIQVGQIREDLAEVYSNAIDKNCHHLTACHHPEVDQYHQSGPHQHQLFLLNYSKPYYLPAKNYNSQNLNHERIKRLTNTSLLICLSFLFRFFFFSRGESEKKACVRLHHVFKNFLMKLTWNIPSHQKVPSPKESTRVCHLHIHPKWEKTLNTI